MPLDPRAVESTSPGLSDAARTRELENRIAALERAGGFLVLRVQAAAPSDTPRTGTPVIQSGTSPTLWVFINGAWVDVATGTGGGGGGGGIAKYAVDVVGNGGATSFSVLHSLGTLDIHVQVWSDAPDSPTVTRDDANTISLNFTTAPSAGTVFRVVVIG